MLSVMHRVQLVLRQICLLWLLSVPQQMSRQLFTGLVTSLHTDAGFDPVLLVAALPH